MSREHRTKRAIYCQVKDLMAINDLGVFGLLFDEISRQYRPDKIYIEIYRHGRTLPHDQCQKLKSFFVSRGLETAAGLTPDEPENNKGGFDTLCYTDEESRNVLTQACRFAASISDELLVDDFLFTNCRCHRCIQNKGERSWSVFRLDLMKDILGNVIIPACRQVNPLIKITIKFPNWYEGYHALGYSLDNVLDQGCAIYTGAETRNPLYTQQHLPKYLSYFIPRALQAANSSGRTSDQGGTWLDPYEVTGNWTWFSEQLEFAMLGRIPEVTLFSLGDLQEPAYRLALPIAGETINRFDRFVPELGNPTGLACLLPGSRPGDGQMDVLPLQGEEYLHGFLGSLGTALEPHRVWPTEEPIVLLSKGAYCGPDTLKVMQNRLIAGQDIVITSGFLRAAQGDLFDTIFTPLRVGFETLDSKRFAYSVDGGVTFAGISESAESVRLPKISYVTNDCWELLAALGTESSAPILLKLDYGNGRLFVLAVPDDPGRLAAFPAEVLNPLREVLSGDSPVLVRGPGKVALFLYDNDCFAVHSLRLTAQIFQLVLRHGYTAIENLETGELLPTDMVSGKAVITLSLRPGVSCLFRLRNGKAPEGTGKL